MKVTNVEIREIIPPAAGAGGDDPPDVGRAHAPRGRDRGRGREAGRDHGAPRATRQSAILNAEGEKQAAILRPRASGSRDPARRGVRARADDDQRVGAERRTQDDEPAVPRGAEGARRRRRRRRSSSRWSSRGSWPASRRSPRSPRARDGRGHDGVELTLARSSGRRPGRPARNPDGRGGVGAGPTRAAVEGRPLEDVELVARARDGDVGAYGELVDAVPGGRVPRRLADRARPRRGGGRGAGGVREGLLRAAAVPRRRAVPAVDPADRLERGEEPRALDPAARARSRSAGSRGRRGGRGPVPRGRGALARRGRGAARARSTGSPSATGW